MRSELVYSARTKIENNFLLAATVMRAVRKLHVTSNRTEDTLNKIFAEVSKGQFAHGELPEVVPTRPINILVTTPI